jgi:membrane AbrB-like protein
MSATLLLTAAVGLISAVTFQRFRLPGGPLVGAMLAVGALHASVEGMTAMPAEVRIAAQIAIGTVVGTTVRREPIVRLARRLPRIIVVTVGVVAAAAVSGIVIARATGLELLTMLLATVPGGASDISAAALDLGPDAAIVAAFQLIRQVTIFVLVGALFTRFLGTTGTDPTGEVG